MVEKASWPGQERILRGTLADIGAKATEAGIKATALILVGEALARGVAPAVGQFLQGLPVELVAGAGHDHIQEPAVHPVDDLLDHLLLFMGGGAER